MTRRFGAYEILHELKAGGMGAVLLGRRRGPGAFEQLVAIKTIRAEYAGAEAVRAMFLDEAAILARINHPGIATVHDFGEENGTLYMVMEYVAGISFRALAEVDTPPGVVARAIAEACRGLHAAHEVRDTAGHLLGVVHRDISPDNLMLGYDGHVKVIDFGIALVKNRQAPVTEFGTVKGKPPYMSPEQVKNEAMDWRSDVFSLAVVLHELLTGVPLFDGDSIYAIARAVEHQEIRAPSVVNGAPLPAGLDAAVMTALERDPARRTPTAAALAEALEGAIAQSGDETLEASADGELAQPRAAHRAWLASVVAGRDAPHPMGRATGAVTALAPLANVTTLPAPVTPAALPVNEQPPDPGASTHLTADTGEEVLQRRVALPLVLALVVLLAIGGGIYFLTRPPTAGTTPADATRADALSIDSRHLVADEHDAAMHDAMSLEASADAYVPDAPARRVAIDARPPRDATIAKAVDAAVPVAAGFGALIVKHHPKSATYVEVRIDGNAFGRTPIVIPKRIEAGAHELVMLRPNTDEVVYRTRIVVTDGETLTVVQATPHQ